MAQTTHAITSTHRSELASMHVIDHALTLFGNAEHTVQWLTSPNSALSGARPWDYLDSDARIERVFVILNRLEFGAYS